MHGSRTWNQKRLFSPKNGDCLSCEQTGIKALSLLCAALQQTGHPASIPRRLSKESSIPGTGVLHVRRTAVPPLHPRTRGPGRSWKREELCFSQGLAWPMALPPNLSPQRTRGLSQKIPIKDAPVPRTPHPRQVKPNTQGALKCFFPKDS